MRIQVGILLSVLSNKLVTPKRMEILHDQNAEVQDITTKQKWKWNDLAENICLLTYQITNHAEYNVAATIVYCSAVCPSHLINLNSIWPGLLRQIKSQGRPK